MTEPGEVEFIAARPLTARPPAPLPLQFTFVPVDPNMSIEGADRVDVPPPPGGGRRGEAVKE
jgi:hypothetical protein